MFPIWRMKPNILFQFTRRLCDETHIDDCYLSASERRAQVLFEIFLKNFYNRVKTGSPWIDFC